MTARIGQAQLCIELETLRAGDELPVELPLFAAGSNKTTKGEFVWSARSVQECANFDAQRGIDSVIDYEHASLSARWANDPAAAGKAAGWYKLDARAEGAFAKGVSWTKSGAQSLNSREFRYLSPTIFFDEDTREITAIVNAALTNNPATMKANPLVMSSDPTENDMKSILVALGLTAAASEGEALIALQQIRRERDEVLSITGKTSAPEAVATISAWKAASARVESLSTEVAKLTAEKTKQGIDAVIKRGLEEKRITPAQVQSLTTNFTSVEALTAFIDASPKNTVLAPPAKEPSSGGANDVASLSAEEKEIAALMGVDLKKLAETKANFPTT